MKLRFNISTFLISITAISVFAALLRFELYEERCSSLPVSVAVNLQNSRNEAIEEIHYSILKVEMSELRSTGIDCSFEAGTESKKLDAQQNRIILNLQTSSSPLLGRILSSKVEVVKFKIFYADGEIKEILDTEWWETRDAEIYLDVSRQNQ